MAMLVPIAFTLDPALPGVSHNYDLNPKIMSCCFTIDPGDPPDVADGFADALGRDVARTIRREAARTGSVRGTIEVRFTGGN